MIEKITFIKYVFTTTFQTYSNRLCLYQQINKYKNKIMNSSEEIENQQSLQNIEHSQYNPQNLEIQNQLSAKENLVKDEEPQPIEVSSQKHMNIDQEWLVHRQKYFQNQQSIKEGKIVVEAILHWIESHHQEQFNKIVNQLNSINFQQEVSLVNVLEKVVEEEKKSWKLSQKYQYEQIRNIIEKVREKYKQLFKNFSKKIKKQKQLVIQKGEDFKNENNEKESENQISQNDVNKISQSHENKNKEKKQEQNQFQKLPTLEQHYHRKSLSNAHQLKSQSELAYKSVRINNEESNKYQPLTHHKNVSFSNDLNKSAKQKTSQNVNKIGNIFKNPYLKMTYRHFCKQNYMTKFTFDLIAESKDEMTLNKWMVFCKEFHFVEKFSKKQLIDIFHVCNQFATKMNLEQFLHGVALIQEKYKSKFHPMDDENFLETVMELTSETAFRIKVANFKIKYSGPTQNSFEQGTYTESAREEIKKEEKRFLEDRKKKQLVLIKGMFSDHIQDQLNQLKVKRTERKIKSSIQNISLLENGLKKLYEESNNKVEPVSTGQIFSRKRQAISYSKIFHNNKSSYGSTQGGSQFIEKRQNLSTNKKLENSMIKNNSLVSNKSKLQIKKMNNFEQNRLTQKQTTTPRREWLLEKKQEPMWITQHMRSDSEESDEILKEHLQIQKKQLTKKKKSENINPIIQQFESNSKALDSMIHEYGLKKLQEESDEDDKVTEYKATHRNIRKEAKP